MMGIKPKAAATLLVAALCGLALPAAAATPATVPQALLERMSAFDDQPSARMRTVTGILRLRSIRA